MIPPWFLALPLNLITFQSGIQGVDIFLVASIIQVESAGNECATRFEPKYNYIYKAKTYAEMNRITVMTEIGQQKTSWGLMQIMGGVSRELAYEGPLVKLCDPETNLKYGIMKLRKFMEKYSETEDAIASYNAGSPIKGTDGKYRNQDYVDKVLLHYEQVRHGN